MIEKAKRDGRIDNSPLIEVISKDRCNVLVATGPKISEVSWVCILAVFAVIHSTSLWSGTSHLAPYLPSSRSRPHLQPPLIGAKVPRLQHESR